MDEKKDSAFAGPLSKGRIGEQKEQFASREHSPATESEESALRLEKSCEILPRLALDSPIRFHGPAQLLYLRKSKRMPSRICRGLIVRVVTRNQSRKLGVNLSCLY